MIIYYLEMIFLIIETNMFCVGWFDVNRDGRESAARSSKQFSWNEHTSIVLCL